MSSKLKSLFFTDNPNEVATSKVDIVSIPGENPVDQTILNETLQRYEQEFDKLNLPGADFYEFCKLIDKAKFYLGELDKFYETGAAEAKRRSDELNNQRT